MRDRQLTRLRDPDTASGGAGALRSPSARLQRFFGWYARHYLRKHLHALRARVPSPLSVDADVPVIVYLNHASWWDPLVAQIIACELFPERLHHAPIAEEGLRKYRFLSRLGFFGIEPGTVRGARRFLQTSGAICSTPRSALWLTPQGRFADPRERPVKLAAGLSHLVRRLDRAFVLPLALEYPFWQERTAEALALAGRPILTAAHEPLTTRQWAELLSGRLEDAQDELARLSRRRDPRDFRTLVDGRAGVGGVYDLWRAATAFLRGEKFRRAHGEGS